MLTREINIQRVESKVNQLIAQSDKSVFIIIDGDRTIIPTDSTVFFFEYLGRSINDLENIFHGSEYAFEAFYNAGKYYSEIDRKEYYEACSISAKSVEIYPEFISFLKSLYNKAEVILVTSGIAYSWKTILTNHSLEYIHLIGGNYFPDDDFVIDKKAKGIISERLIASQKDVFAFGDTMIDFEMLQKANHSFLVVNDTKNKDFVDFFEAIPQLQQISFFDFTHSNLPLTNLVSIANKILNK